MGSRRLVPPIEPGDDETISQYRRREKTSKRRLQIFRRLYGKYLEWESQYQAGECEEIWPTPDGEEVYMPDLLVGLPLLPPRQRQAFTLHTLKGMTEAAAAREMGFEHWSTPVQQYNKMAIYVLVVAYDKKQAGTWNLQEELNEKKRKRRRKNAGLTTHAVFKNKDIEVQIQRKDPKFEFTEKFAKVKAVTVEEAIRAMIDKCLRYGYVPKLFAPDRMQIWNTERNTLLCEVRVDTVTS